MSSSFEITSIRLYTPLRNQLRGLHGVYNLIEVISSWTEQNCDQSLNVLLFSNVVTLYATLQLNCEKPPCLILIALAMNIIFHYVILYSTEFPESYNSLIKDILVWEIVWPHSDCPNLQWMLTTIYHFVFDVTSGFV